MGWKKLFGAGGRDESPTESDPLCGEIVFFDGDQGMVTTTDGLALRFGLEECKGFAPAAGNQVTLERTEGIRACGLSLKAVGPPPRFMFGERANAESGGDPLVRETQDDRDLRPLTATELRERLPTIDWRDVFTDVLRTERGLDPQALAKALAQLQQPFDRGEMEELLAFGSTATPSNPFREIAQRWPHSWLSFMTWSNGGDFISGDRAFQDMFSLEQVREFTTVYGIPCFLPGAIPFAMDGGGALYLFDARETSAAEECPIVFCHSSEVEGGWGAVARLEDSFLECCRSSIDPNALSLA